MELIVNTGSGYVLAQKNKNEDTPLGMIAIDSLFSPVKRVSYKIDTTREGAALDYDKLLMEVETNGTVPAEDAVALLQEFFKTNFQCLLTLKIQKKRLNKKHQ